MRTAKCVILPVVVTLAGVVALAAAAGQDNPSTPSPAPQRELSGTRTASCVVRIALDPAVMTLSESTVSGLVYSSAVAGQAAREVLHKDLLDQAEGFIQIEWLDMSDASSAPAGRPTNEGYDEQMMRELQQIYGQPYATLFMQQRENADKTGDNREEQPVPKNPKDRRGTSEPPRSSGVQNPYGEMYGMRPGYGRMMRPQVPTDAGQAATIRLSVFMARNDTPAAKELLRAVISNLRSSLRYAYESYLSDLDDQLEGVRRQHAAAVEMLEGGTEPAAPQIMEQLRRNVDLSALNPEMRLKEAIEYLRRSVEPPLQIVVLWNVLEPTEVYPIQPIGIEALPNVRLGTALDVLLKNIVSKGPQVVYKIEGDVIVIGPESSLQQAPASREPMQVETDARTLAAQRSELARRVQNLYLDLASLEARRDTIEKLVLEIRVKADRQVAEDTVMQEMRKLVDLHTKRLADLQAAAAAGRVAQGELAQPQEDLTRAKIELARRREELSKSAGGSQLDELNGELSRMTIDKAEKEMQRKILLAQLQEVQQQLARASAFDPEAAQRRIAQEALDLAAGRMAELQMRITNLQPPTVTVLGAN